MAKSKGLGDTIAKITEAIGIIPCEGCNKRKESLNRLFPFKRVDSSKVDLIKDVDSLSDMELIELYNSVFNTSIEIESFKENIRNAVIADLKKLS